MKRFISALLCFVVAVLLAFMVDAQVAASPDIAKNKTVVTYPAPVVSQQFDVTIERTDLKIRSSYHSPFAERLRSLITLINKKKAEAPIYSRHQPNIVLLA